MAGTDLGLLVAVARHSYRRHTTYRAATIAGIFTNTVFGFIYAFVMQAVYSERSEIDGFDSVATVTYIFLSQAFLMMTGAFGDRELSDRIREGDIATDLYRPVDLQAWWLATDLGKSLFYALFRGLPPLAAGALVFQLAVSDAPWRWLLFLTSTIFGVVIAFGLRFMANLSGFWLLDAKGVVSLTAIMQVFGAGHIVPLYFLPDPLETVVRILPFASITSTPLEILLGAWSPGRLLATVGLQIAWMVVVLVLGRRMLSAARRKLVVQGG